MGRRTAGSRRLRSSLRASERAQKRTPSRTTRVPVLRPGVAGFLLTSSRALSSRHSTLNTASPTRGAATSRQSNTGVRPDRSHSDAVPGASTDVALAASMKSSPMMLTTHSRVSCRCRSVSLDDSPPGPAMPSTNSGGSWDTMLNQLNGARLYCGSAPAAAAERVDTNPIGRGTMAEISSL